MVCYGLSSRGVMTRRRLLFEKRLNTKFLILRSALIHVRRHWTHFFTQNSIKLRLLAQYFSVVSSRTRNVFSLLLLSLFSVLSVLF